MCVLCVRVWAICEWLWIWCITTYTWHAQAHENTHRLILTRVDLLYVCKNTWLRTLFMLLQCARWWCWLLVVLCGRVRKQCKCHNWSEMKFKANAQGAKRECEVKWHSMRCACAIYYYIYPFPYIFIYKMITFISKSCFISILSPNVHALFRHLTTFVPFSSAANANHHFECRNV